MKDVEIRVKGQLDESRSEWFEGLEIVSCEPGETMLAGPVIDQSVLFGILTKIRNLGLELVSVKVTELTADGAETDK